MSVISFDVGNHNLGVCFIQPIGEIENKLFKVKHIELIDLKGTCVRESVCSLVEVLKNKIFPWITNTSNLPVIAIESQPNTNPGMKCISHGIQTCFLSCFENIDVRFISPRNKLTICPSTFLTKEEQANVDVIIEKKTTNKKASYRCNKKLAVIYATGMLREAKQQKSLDFFQSCNKKDDIADSYLQGAHCLLTILEKKKKKRKRGEK
tara:strand:- start:256 stop:879 length:624 start_codon:yes stop_codon:yes gene_type:complete